MSKKNRDRRSAAQVVSAAPPPGPITYTTALKPHPRLLVILSIIFALWVGALVTLYFTTVYPYRHQRTLPTSVDNLP